MNSGDLPSRTSRWSDLVLKEDWWAIWLGLTIILVACGLFAGGTSLKWIAVAPPKWDSLSDLSMHFSANLENYLAQFLMWLLFFGLAMRAMRQDVRHFIPAFVFIYLASVAIIALGAWQHASRYNLEPPLVALLVGMLIANVIGLPRWMDAGFRVEFYIKTGIVLLGATLPFTLIIWAGPVAVLQATLVSVTTFFVIFLVGKRLGLDRRLCATLGAGGAVCGVSAAIAISAAVGAKREHAPVAITLVILWAIVMIFVLPLVCRALELHAGVAGAWIGTSEFADAAGLAAAQAYGNTADALPEIEGSSEDAVRTFTLMKVVGRDIWIGIWALILSVVATTRWETERTQAKADLGQVWMRFPKFVLGFAIASLIVTGISGQYTLAEFDELVTPDLISPVKTLRTWAFIFCFLSIGLTTRFRELAAAGLRPFLAFTAGVGVNVVIGFVLSVLVFGAYWSTLSR